MKLTDDELEQAAGGAIVQHDDGTYQVFKSYGNPDLFGESYKTLEETQQAHANYPDNLVGSPTVVSQAYYDYLAGKKRRKKSGASPKFH
jgi:hypothetical protein